MRKLILPGAVVLILGACGPDETEMAQAPAPANDTAPAGDRSAANDGLPPLDRPDA